MGSLIRKIPNRPGMKLFEDYKFCVGVDLGQSVDPTAICVLQHVKKAEVSWKGIERAIGEEFHVRYLARLPLGLSYIAQVQQVIRLLNRPPLEPTTELVIDETGVGRPVGDLFDNAGLRPTRVTITAGERATCKGTRSWHVPKGELISNLDARLHSGELKFAADLAEAPAMANELRDFRHSVSAAGRFSYDARVGKHDDLILACALALWAFVGRLKHPPAMVGKYGISGTIFN